MLFIKRKPILTKLRQGMLERINTLLYF